MNNTSLRQNGYGQCCFLNALMLLIYTRTPFFSQVSSKVSFPTRSTGRFPNSVDRSVPQLGRQVGPPTQFPNAADRS